MDVSVYYWCSCTPGRDVDQTAYIFGNVRGDSCDNTRATYRSAVGRCDLGVGVQRLCNHAPIKLGHYLNAKPRKDDRERARWAIFYAKTRMGWKVTA